MNVPADKFEDWLINKNLKQRTIESYIYYFNKFIYDRFDQESVSKFLSKKSNRNGVARSFLINLKKFLLVNRSEFKIDEDYYQDIVEVELPKLTGRLKERLINPLPHNQILLLEQYLPTEKLKLQLLLSYYGAMRLGELLKINVGSFNWEIWKENPKKMGECRVYGKGDKEGICLIPSELMFRVSDFIIKSKFKNLSDYLFIKDKGKFENKSRLWQLRLSQAGVKSGITKLNPKGIKIKETIVHPHRLRHSFANHLLKDRKVNLRYVQEALRHSSIQSTQRYTKVDIEDLKGVLNENKDIQPER